MLIGIPRNPHFTSSDTEPANNDMMAWMYIAIRVAVAIVAVVFGFARGQQSRPEAMKADPLVGDWEGSWSYPTGMDVHIGTFRLYFAEKDGRLQGQFLALERKHVIFTPKTEGSKELIDKTTTERLPHRLERIRNLVRTSAEPPKYRWYADGDCWNVVIEGQQMSGLLNGGPCSVVGIGSGARLIELGAKRVVPKER